MRREDFRFSNLERDKAAMRARLRQGDDHGKYAVKIRHHYPS